MDAVQRHRSMYKGTTPPWKETYRKRCVERLKNSRSRLLEKFRQIEDEVDQTKRSLVQEVMEEEWSTLRLSSGALPSLWRGSSVGDLFTAQQEFDELAALEEIQQELISQELLLVKEYQQSQEFEDQYLDWALEVLEPQGRIICPVCRANNLTLNSHFLSCPCGLYVKMFGRGVTSDMLEKLLEARVMEHMSECVHNPSFSVACNADLSSSLMISCSVCDYLSVVL